jgi:hypothetical protein
MVFNVYEWRRNQLITESEEKSTVIVKKIKDLTWEDVDGLALPTNSAGTLAAMKATKDLDSWKSKFKGDEAEMEVTIDRKATPWFNQVKIEKLIQSDPMGFQAKIDTEKGKKSGLDEMQGEEYDEDTVNPNDYADNPGYNDKVTFLADTFQYVWGMGKGNNTINFKGMAESTIEDLETRF